MKTDDIISNLTVCGNRKPNCEGCTLVYGNNSRCYDDLKKIAAREIRLLREESNYLRRLLNERNL